MLLVCFANVSTVPTLTVNRWQTKFLFQTLHAENVLFGTLDFSQAQVFILLSTDIYMFGLQVEDKELLSEYATDNEGRHVFVMKDMEELHATFDEMIGMASPPGTHILLCSISETAVKTLTYINVTYVVFI